MGQTMQSLQSVSPLFPLYLRNQLTTDLELLHVSSHDHSSQGIEGQGYRDGVTGQANAVGPTLIEGS